MAFLALSGCAPYRFGNGSLYSSHIRTVHVPVFRSDSYRRNLGERLTEAVVKEIELKSSYKVVRDGRADSVLIGRITGDTKRVLIENNQDEPRDIELNLYVDVQWVDRATGQVMASQSIPLPADVVGVGQTANIVPEIGESIATSQQEAISKLATQIVALMEAPW